MTLKKINSLQLLGSVIDNYSMESFFDYYVNIQIEREIDYLQKTVLYESEVLMDDDFGCENNSDDDYDYFEYWTEDDMRIKYGFEE